METFHWSSDIDRKRLIACSLMNSMSNNIHNVLERSLPVNNERRDIREINPIDLYHERNGYFGSSDRPIEVRVLNSMGRSEHERNREVYFAGKRRASDLYERDSELPIFKRLDTGRSRDSGQFQSFEHDYLNYIAPLDDSPYNDYRREHSEHEDDSFVYPDLIRNEKKLIKIRIYDRSLGSKRIDKEKAENFFFILTEQVRNSKGLNFIEFFDVRFEEGSFYLNTQTFRNYHWLCRAIANDFASFNLRAELAYGKKVTFAVPTREKRLGIKEIRKIISTSSRYPIDFSQWILKSSKKRGRKTYYNYYVQNISEDKLRRLIGNFKRDDKIISIAISD